MRTLLFVIVALLLSIHATAQEADLLMNTQALRDSNAFITLTPKKESIIGSQFDEGKVLRSVNDPDNAAGFSRFVEIEYPIHITYKGQGMDLYIYLLYSNLKEALVSDGQVVHGGDPIGTTYDEAQTGDRRWYVYLYTYDEDNPFLMLKSKGNRMKIGSRFFWDPLFLFRG